MGNWTATNALRLSLRCAFDPGELTMTSFLFVLIALAVILAIRNFRKRRPGSQGSIVYLPAPTLPLGVGSATSCYKAEAIKVLEELRRTPPPGLPEVLGRLRRMNAYAFEDLVMLCLAERGLSVCWNRRRTHDGGVDGRVDLGGVRFLCQMKRWKGHVDHRDIRRLGALIAGKGLGGLFIHTGRTGKLSRRSCAKVGISLISGRQLVALVLGSSVPIQWPPQVPAPALNECTAS